MSVWTHVAAVFRIDGFSSKILGTTIDLQDKLDKVIGKTIYDGDWLTEDTYERKRIDDDWCEYRKHPEQFVPTGSEGSLQCLVWVNPDNHSLARYTVTVFGDLRDYEDLDSIESWFMGACKKCGLALRQAVCHCTNGSDTKVFYDET